MTHCMGYRAAAVASAARVATLGIDAEPHRSLPPAIFEEIAGIEERRHIGRLAAVHPHLHWDRLLFSAKESIYKCWYPLERTWLGFEDAKVQLQPGGRFTAELCGQPLHLPRGAVARLVGRWAVVDGLIMTAVCVTV